MSLDLVSLLLEAAQEREEETLSLRARLEVLERTYPGNQRALCMPTPDPAVASERVRIKRAREHLSGVGVRVCGPLPSQSCVDWQLRIQASFSRSGRLYSLSLQLKEGEEELLRPLVQETFLREGIRVISCLDGSLQPLSNLAGLHPSQQAFLELGLSPGLDSCLSVDQACEWLEAIGEENADWLGEWIHRRFTPAQAGEWIKAGVCTPTQACSWREHKFSPSEAAEWLPLHPSIQWPEIAQKLRAQKVTPAWIRGWTPLLKRSWMLSNGEFHLRMREAGLTLAAAERMEESGSDAQTLEQLLRWVEEGEPLESALQWSELHPHMAGAQACAHRAAGRDLEEVKQWLAASPHFVSSSLVDSWLEEPGMSPEKAGRWAGHSSNHGRGALHRPEVALKWRKLGGWMDRPERVARLIELGLTPEQVEAVLSEYLAASSPETGSS